MESKKSFFLSKIVINIQSVQPQRNACTRPKVDHYIVNYNRQSFTVNDTSLSMNLPSTINTGGNLSVGIIAVNAVGMGNPATIISVPFPNSAITRK